MRRNAFATKNESSERLPRKTTVQRMTEYRGRYGEAGSAGWKFEDLVRITVKDKSHRLEDLSKKKQRFVRFILKDPASLREYLQTHG